MRYTLLLFVLFLQLSSFAQESIPKSGIKFGAYLGSDIAFLKNSKLNDYLDANNFRTCSTSQFDSFIGYTLRQSTSPLSFNVYLKYSESSLFSGINDSEFTTIGGGVDMFYDIFRDSKWNISPLVGLVKSKYKLRALSRTDTSIHSGEYFAESLLINDSFIVNMGVQLSRTFAVSIYDIRVGVNGKYMIDILSDTWFGDKTAETNKLPMLDLTGFAVGLDVRVEFNLNRIFGISPNL